MELNVTDLILRKSKSMLPESLHWLYAASDAGVDFSGDFPKFGKGWKYRLGTSSTDDGSAVISWYIDFEDEALAAAFILKWM